MKNFFKIITCSILVIILTSCLSLSPAGFWQGFQEEYQVEHLSDQGPWGGKRVVHWKGFTPKFDFDYIGFKDFPRWISGSILVMSFTTGYISIDLETQEDINMNGFIILNEKQNEMTLYHMWGE